MEHQRHSIAALPKYDKVRPRTLTEVGATRHKGGHLFHHEPMRGAPSFEGLPWTAQPRRSVLDYHCGYCYSIKDGAFEAMRWVGE